MIAFELSGGSLEPNLQAILLFWNVAIRTFVLKNYYQLWRANKTSSPQIV